MNRLIERHKKERIQLYSSLLLFTRVFFETRTGNRFELSKPDHCESHYIQICRALMKVFKGETKNLIINIPPRYGKTELLIHFVAWAMARYPDCNFLYTSYSHSLASKQTAIVRDIMYLNEYHQMFYVELKSSSKSKFDFETTEGGSVYAAGFGGTITGRGAGIKGCKRFGGAIIIDDAHKPAEAHSDTIREGVIDWFRNTLKSRRNDGNKTPIIFIGQRVHEYDLPAYLMEDDNEEWETLIIPALSDEKVALHKEMHSIEDLLDMQESDPYNFAAQYQQNPQPSGGGIWKTEWFKKVHEAPEILMTFITVDTAETDKTYNDATVFSFWGYHKIKPQKDIDLELYGLYWIDCLEIRIEPKDLEHEFRQFYYNCMRYKVKPTVAIIERKSTGVTLSSVLSDTPGLQIINIERTSASGSKTERFLSIQKYIATKRITLPTEGKHTQMCIDHCAKITANDTHRHDDIADTLYDAVKLALIDKTLPEMYVTPKYSARADTLKTLARSHKRLSNLKRARS